MNAVAVCLAMYRYGVRHGRESERRAWQRIYAVQMTPERAELTNEPCSSTCGKCSRCVRSQAVWSRRRAGLPDDHMGGPVASW